MSGGGCSECGVTALLRSVRRVVRRWQYRRYLRSSGWKRRRRAAVKRAGFRCERCGCGGRLEVHHLTYERLGHERPGDLVALCRACHRQAHEQNGRKAWAKAQ